LETGGGGASIGDNSIIGAVGVSGGTSDKDEACAIEGLRIEIQGLTEIFHHLNLVLRLALDR